MNIALDSIPDTTQTCIHTHACIHACTQLPRGFQCGKDRLRMFYPHNLVFPME